MADTPQTAIRNQAIALGFDAVGFARPDDFEETGEALEAFIEAGHHGTMGWMKERLYHRKSPKNLWPEVRSIVALAMNYGPDHDPMDNLAKQTTGNISVYARGRDYHDVLKKRMKHLGRWMAETFQCNLKVFVDTAPVMEKPLAALAGIGWQGKHTNLVSRDFGSWLFLGIIYTDMNLMAGTTTADHCGHCSACIKACPTGALIAPYKMDARRCISYLTIEHKDPIPVKYRRLMGNRIYGCDDCLAVCPWNKFASQAKEARFHAREALKNPPLCDLVQLDDTAFRALFSGSPIKRIGRDRFVRNVLIAIGNSGDRSFLPLVEKLTGDDSALVRDAACWAFQALKPEL